MGKLDRKVTNADSLSLDHLDAFIAVVETGSQVRAAKRLGMRPTTIGRHIKRVQEHFGGGLFQAGASGPLSTRGSLLEQSIRTAMAELSRTRDRLSTERPVLRIGFIRLMRPLVEKALRSHVKTRGVPEFDARLVELTSELQARALGNRELDIAICYALPELAARSGIEGSLVTEQPYALAIPERAWIKGKLATRVLADLHYVHSPRRFANQVVEAEEQWLKENHLVPVHRIECALGAEILAYAGAGHGYGFLPALWSAANHERVVFAPMTNFAPTAKIAAYTLQHVTPWVTELRRSLSAAAREALRDFRIK